MQCKLTLNRDEVSPDHNVIKMVEFDDHVLITVMSISQLYTGRYELTVSNESGQATCGWYMNVTGLPGPPTGPLGISHVNQHQAVLNWKPPREDGGAKVTHYVVEKRDTSKDAQDWTVVASYVKVKQPLVGRTGHIFVSCKTHFRTQCLTFKDYLKITNTNSASVLLMKMVTVHR